MSETNVVKDESGVAQRSELQPVVMQEKLSLDIPIRGSEGIYMEEGWKTGNMTESGLGIDAVYYAGKGRFGGCIDRVQVTELRDFLNSVIAKWEADA